jgi:DNA-binding response OmpR family regulator
VIDDDPVVTSTFAKMLSLEGYIVQTALDTETGLQKANAYRPAAILVDLRMPLGDGLTFLRRLRDQHHHRETPVAIVTGDYMIDDAMMAALRAHGATIRFKPLWFEDLIRLTHDLVQQDPSPTVNLPRLP